MFKQFVGGVAVVGLVLAFACVERQGKPPDEQSFAPSPQTDVDTSVAPGGDDAPGAKAVGGSTQLRVDMIRTRHLMNGTVTAGKVGYKAVAVTVTAGGATATTTADPDIALGVLVGCHPNSNQDQFVDNIVLNANGSITMTLAANATANNVFRCIVLKPNAKGTS